MISKKYKKENSIYVERLIKILNEMMQFEPKERLDFVSLYVLSRKMNVIPQNPEILNWMILHKDYEDSNPEIDFWMKVHNYE